MLYLTIKTMEININCDLGEKSKHHSNKHDPELLKIVNSANVACGFHAGDEDTMDQVVQISKENGVSIGAHPSYGSVKTFFLTPVIVSESPSLSVSFSSKSPVWSP